uniref:ATP-binding cassette sub-family A member 1-like n=1 Tax=Callorhinchus milii TaxID=7868 RepID=A0A4W3H6Q8_CALMI
DCSVCPKRISYFDVVSAFADGAIPSKRGRVSRPSEQTLQPVSEEGDGGNPDADPEHRETDFLQITDGKGSHQLHGWRLTCQQFQSLFTKRFLYARRSRRGLFAQVKLGLAHSHPATPHHLASTPSPRIHPITSHPPHHLASTPSPRIHPITSHPPHHLASTPSPRIHPITSHPPHHLASTPSPRIHPITSHPPHHLASTPSPRIHPITWHPPHHLASTPSPRIHPITSHPPHHLASTPSPRIHPITSHPPHHLASTPSPRIHPITSHPPHHLTGCVTHANTNNNKNKIPFIERLSRRENVPRRWTVGSGP